LSVELQGEFGGEKLSPKNFDVVGAMNYVSALLDLIAALAEKHKEPLSFQGMSLEPGSVAFKIDVDQPTTARRLAGEAGEMVGGRVLPPHGLRNRVARVVESVSKLPPGVTSIVKVGRHKTVIAPPRFDTLSRATEEAEFRVRVYRVGGEPARLWAITETDGAFTAALTHELAENIANYLCKRRMTRRRCGGSGSLSPRRAGTTSTTSKLNSSVKLQTDEQHRSRPAPGEVPN
jgi:hypothetical protein